jgi:hypothetical protein
MEFFNKKKPTKTWVKIADPPKKLDTRTQLVSPKQ